MAKVVTQITAKVPRLMEAGEYRALRFAGGKPSLHQLKKWIDEGVIVGEVKGEMYFVDKHTFGRRLRAAGVSLENRKALLGHKNGSVTSHYSGAELGQLIDAANKVSVTDSRGPVLTILRRANG